MEQTYGNPESRNKMRAVGNMLKSGQAIGGGGNQTQGKGEIPGKVSVPMPGTNATQPAYRKEGGAVKAPVGFNNGLINGKI
ncbi:hypothetical protein UFOVP715_61 [uncultured Caudovirales phage]|jgi:hypothetical protein|uniref:Uncharacterized protein n=1 Tax=uncultured Caudovirales phage TaxID=2100421 RepID=A0A6J5NWP1_9CAUD|nr:hypothetical protein UFOVP715_61 [uncultured Caudovirales phage]